MKKQLFILAATLLSYKSYASNEPAPVTQDLAPSNQAVYQIPCGICTQDISYPSVCWQSDRSNFVHSACYELVRGAQSDMKPRLASRPNFAQNHKAIVRTVEVKCQELEGCTSIKEYVQKAGAPALKSLFDAETTELLEANNQ